MGQQWQEAEITAIRERAELSTKEDPSKASNYPRQESSRPLASPLPSVSSTETAVTVLCGIDTVVVNVDAGWIITPSVRMGTALLAKLPQPLSVTYNMEEFSQDMFHG